MTVYLSNHLEILAEHLTLNLCASSTLFSKKILIVPNFSLKEWISFYLADHTKEKIVMGYTILYLDQAIHFFIKKNRQLSPIAKILKIKDEWEEEISFASCQMLAHLFEIYGTYGREVLKKWEKEPKNSQERLWKAFSETYSYPYRYLQEEILTADVESVHIFGFSHLSYLHFSFFDRLSKKIPTSLYHLSPCKEFWSDTVSDKEAKRFFKRTPLTDDLKLAFENYLEDRHPLLANLGKVGREFAFLVEESGWQTVESYVESTSKTQLESIQNDLLQLKQDDHLFQDDSIQIHICSTKHREIQNLVHTLKALMVRNKIEPKEILVMAPDITAYAPYIQTYFGEEIPYKIADMPVYTENREILALFKLLELEEKRWSVSALMMLFNHPLFRKKQKWDEKQLSSIRKWAELGGIRWGKNKEHANLLLQNKHCHMPFEEASHTWEAGLERLYKSLVFFQEQREIEIVESELLGELSFLVESLYKDLRPLYDGSKRSCEDWAEYLKALFSAYFVSEDESLFLRISSLKEASKPYAFLEIWPFFKTFLGQEKVTLHREQHQAITFCSMLPMRTVPAEIIVLLGMQHDQYPRKDSFSSFNLLLKEKNRDYFPSPSDEDRHLFLEALLSARKFFIISYIGKSPYDQTTIPESSVLSELQRFLISKNVIIHPDAPFDPLYFQNSPICLKNNSVDDYQAALVLTQPTKKKRAFFAFTGSTSFHIPEGNHIIDIHLLRRLCRVPISCYLEKNFEIFFEKEKSEKDLEEFFLSPLYVAQARRMLGEKPLDKVAFELANKGALPAGAFKKIAIHRLAQDQELISPYTLKTIHFSLGETDLIFDQKEGWKSPPLQFSYDQNRTIRFVGKIPGVFSKGLFTFERAQFPSAIKHWADFLLLNFSGIVDGSTLIFGKEKKEKIRFFQHTEPFLKTLVEYYFYALKTPSMLLPEWVDPILEGNWDKLQTLFEKKSGYDEGAYWMFHDLPLEHINKELTQKFGTLLYKEMKDAWF